ncbi:hypothetical protein RclHR1_05020005 [Rhizophagus clarus]|uniref:Uncharacterized protein n=1 Tax=Rhizophagus clarus TaxID=94130 RepID=A0A2Z6RK17_9GLOM|nr:hypothetical protein RclHR1_05020005 [Rhizophagus clarus]GET04287.1 hypothetical protein RCL_jg24609.t1 [Rhizophagus clarus]
MTTSITLKKAVIVNICEKSQPLLPDSQPMVNVSIDDPDHLPPKVSVKTVLGTELLVEVISNDEFLILLSKEFTINDLSYMFKKVVTLNEQ